VTKLARRKRSCVDSGIFSTTPFKLPKNTFPSIGKTTPKRDTRRTFTATQKKEILYQQGGKCASSECQHKKLDPRATHFHHEKPWGSGGRTIIANGRALCADCHEIASHRQRVKDVDKKRPTRDSNPFSNLP
jgi:hypothetical protein